LGRDQNLRKLLSEQQLTNDSPDSGRSPIE
jgi:hypothetical protein